MNEDAFDSWWNGLEGFHLLSERIYDDLCDENVSPELLRTWMKACWNAALEAAENEYCHDCGKYYSTQLKELKTKIT